MAHSGMWIKVRKPISPYPETPQQRKVKIGGFMIRDACKGKKAEDFFQCRSGVLACAFDDGKCDERMREMKRKALAELGEVATPKI